MKSEGFETVSIQLCTGVQLAFVFDIIDDPVTVEIKKGLKVHTPL